MNTAELMVRCLEEEGVSHIYGVPGEENEDLMFALEQSSIDFINCRHEQGAAFMVNVYGRLTGKAGVCLSTLGPGATNLITGIADANLDKAPLVALTAQGGLDRIHHESHQLVDVMAILEPITKYNASIYDTRVTREVIRKSFKTAQEEKPGAAHIELSESVACETVQKTIPLKPLRPRLSAPDSRSIQEAISLLKKASKPIILAGNGALRNRASKALTNFAQSHNIPVAVTFMGKGAIDTSLNQSVFTAGLGFKDYVIEAFEQADVVLCIGYDIAEYDPKMWHTETSKSIIHIDFVSAEIYEEYIPDIQIISDIELAIKELSRGLASKIYSSWFAPIRQNILTSIKNYYRSAEAAIFSVPSVVGVVNDIMDEQTLVISDVGAHKMWIARNLLNNSPQSCIISNGMASMGIALPGAIGAHVSGVKRNIISMMGDGGFLMNVQELETAKRLQISACILVFVNNDYELISWKQKRSAGKSFGTTFGNPDFEKLAEAFGIEAYVPSNHLDLRNRIKDIWDRQALGLLIVPVESDVNNHLITELEKYYDQ